MHISAAACCLAALVATLVVLTTSLPQSPSRPTEGVSRRTRYPIHPVNDRPPPGCPGVGAINYQEDIELKLMKRVERYLPCGKIDTGGQTDTFEFATTLALDMSWLIAKSHVHREIRLMQVNPHGPDIVVRLVGARDRHLFNFVPVKGAKYYITLSGLFAVQMAWYFRFQLLHALSVTLCSGALAYQAEQTVMTNPHAATPGSRASAYPAEQTVMSEPLAGSRKSSRTTREAGDYVGESSCSVLIGIFYSTGGEGCSYVSEEEEDHTGQILSSARVIHGNSGMLRHCSAYPTNISQDISSKGKFTRSVSLTP